MKEFAAQGKRQIDESGYRLIYLADDGEVKAVAGIRIAEWLARGMSMDLEDLVATESDRSKGYGGQLFDWLLEYGRERNCTEIRLVSHVTRFRAHQFCLKKKMILDGHFFSISLNSEGQATTLVANPRRARETDACFHIVPYTSR